MLVVLATSVSSSAFADAKAAAEALFVEGRQLLAQGKYAEACPKLEASNRLDPAVGTLLNLAMCYEKAGKTASAWATYVQAMTTYPQQPNDFRLDYAKQHASALLPVLSKVTIQTPNVPADARVTRDGVVVASASFNVAVPLDPGHHVIEATASGRVRFHREFDLASSANLTVVIVLPVS